MTKTQLSLSQEAYLRDLKGPHQPVTRLAVPIQVIYSFPLIPAQG